MNDKQENRPDHTVESGIKPAAATNRNTAQPSRLRGEKQTRPKRRDHLISVNPRGDRWSPDENFNKQRNTLGFTHCLTRHEGNACGGNDRESETEGMRD